jgi:diguanylate cyclase (GGDEF)-like protein/PAS domain S-box-containing protein
LSGSGEYLDQPSLDSAADALLSRNGVMAMALTEAAVRVPLPDDARFDRAATLPGSRETVVDFVVVADRMSVVTTWERAQEIGLAQSNVRLSGEPDRAFSFTVVDARHRHGVWLGFLIAEDQWSCQDAAPVSPSLFIPSRPRTATVGKNLSAVITQVDERVEPMLGWTGSDMIGHRSLEFIHPDDHERAIGQWLEMRACRKTQRCRVRHRLKEGGWLWVEMENRFVGLDDPNRLVAVCELSDISDEMAAHEQVQRREKLFYRLAEFLPEGLLLVDVQHSIVYANARLRFILGVHAAASVHDLLAHVLPAGRDALLGALSMAMNDHIDRRVEVEVMDPQTGAMRSCLADVTALSDDDGLPGAIITMSDVTEIAKLREELRRRAAYDSLTGCLNRASTLAALRHVLDREQPMPAAVLFIDLDDFKTVNDTHGHTVGDKLLADVARLIAAQARADDVVGRIGGDEFVMICHHLDHSTDALAVADRIYAALDCMVAVGDHKVRVSASVGVTIATPGASIHALLDRADEAMYQSKRRKDRTPVFLSATSESVRR